MSHATSPSTEQRYGVVRVTHEWEMARSSFYYPLRRAAQSERALRRRGPKTEWSDAALLEKIRAVLAASPFYGEGHRNVWARLRFQQVRTSKARVLRLMPIHRVAVKPWENPRRQESGVLEQHLPILNAFCGRCALN